MNPSYINLGKTEEICQQNDHKKFTVKLHQKVVTRKFRYHQYDNKMKNDQSMNVLKMKVVHHPLCKFKHTIDQSQSATDFPNLKYDKYLDTEHSKQENHYLEISGLNSGINLRIANTKSQGFNHEASKSTETVSEDHNSSQYGQVVAPIPRVKKFKQPQHKVHNDRPLNILIADGENQNELNNISRQDTTY